MTEKQQLVFNYNKNSEEALMQLQNIGFLFLDNRIIWNILAYELDHIEIPTEVFFHGLSAKEIFNLIQGYLNKNGSLMHNLLLENSVIPENLVNDLIKGRVKHKGEIWTIHKNDKDTFPSNPHAHNYDRQYKLHLGNGMIFQKTKYIKSISSNDLMNIRELIELKIKDIKLPPYTKTKSYE